jgi:hypothetical protein
MRGAGLAGKLCLVSTLVLAAVVPARAQDALVFDSSAGQASGAGVFLAVALGLDPVIASAQSSTALDFTSQVALGGWEILVVDTTGGAPAGPWQQALVDAIADGTCVVATIADPTDAALLAPAFEASIVGTHGPLAVHNWAPHQVFFHEDLVPNPLNPVDDNYEPNGYRLDPIGTGQAMAGFVPNPAAGEAAIISGYFGRTLFNGFLFDDFAPANADADGRDDATELGVNEVLWVNSFGNCAANRAAAAPEVPTLGEWGFGVLALGLGAAGLRRLRRRA